MYDKVEKIINEWDPIELFPMAPKDEYSQEIKKIVNILKDKSSLDKEKLANSLKMIFVESFGKDMFFRDNESNIAEKLLNIE
ncbi:DUF1871 family protein [Enterococcus gallinarum]|uniref:DUF1871 family protein n=1 Tax=Enterococcus gallinarum TaxID=1353 RepID=A0A376H033_ENTGA|nr:MULTISPECIES: DUF1871 family protein [Enterococcus]HAP5746487.1 DUF1871 family protein [Enterococcus faecalis]MDT2688220.1 DUF1871 family protein [Enterococcus gallinarum]MDT2691163.1 DUF1871 family protein [Enterococcus gallinarum]CAI3304161.1 hypothetical protein CIRMBP1246_00743 [Enterococcus cecorum]CAI3370006.1 hypothetical protein CIRMBP1231_01216 [Enterococcus cecorum]